MSTKKTIAPVLVDKLPEFAKDLYPRFVQFMRDYIDFLEQDENFLRVILDWKHNTDPDNNVDPYIDALLRDLGFQSGQNLAIDKRLLLHNLREFYLSRGSEASFKFLFRALFNEDVSIRYPREQLLIPSYASYGERHFIFTSAANRDTDQYHRLVANIRESGGTVRGLSSGVIASIENIVIQHGSGTPYLRIEILQPTFEFEVNETAILESGGFSISESVKPILELRVVHRGNGYTIDDKISVNGANLQGQIVVEAVSRGGITHLRHLGTSGWKVGDLIKAHPEDGGFGFTAKVTEVNGAGEILDYRVVSPGYNYSRVPPLTHANTNPNAQNIGATSTEIGGIVKVKTISPFVDFDPARVSFDIVSVGDSFGAWLEPVAVTRWSYNDWTDRKGFIGENSTLIDSDKYQQYSYTIVSSIASTQYDGFVTEMLHPAGYVKTSSYEIISHLSLSLQSGGSVSGGSVSIDFPTTLELEFDASFDTDEVVMFVTDTGETLVTDNNYDLVIAE